MFEAGCISICGLNLHGFLTVFMYTNYTYSPNLVFIFQNLLKPERKEMVHHSSR